MGTRLSERSKPKLETGEGGGRWVEVRSVSPSSGRDVSVGSGVFPNSTGVTVSYPSFNRGHEEGDGTAKERTFVGTSDLPHRSGRAPEHSPVGPSAD